MNPIIQEIQIIPNHKRKKIKMLLKTLINIIIILKH